MSTIIIDEFELSDGYLHRVSEPAIKSVLFNTKLFYKKVFDKTKNFYKNLFNKIIGSSKNTFIKYNDYADNHPIASYIFSIGTGLLLRFIICKIGGFKYFAPGFQRKEN